MEFSYHKLWEGKLKKYFLYCKHCNDVCPIDEFYIDFEAYLKVKIVANGDKLQYRIIENEIETDLVEAPIVHKKCDNAYFTVTGSEVTWKTPDCLMSYVIEYDTETNSIKLPPENDCCGDRNKFYDICNLSEDEILKRIKQHISKSVWRY